MSELALSNIRKSFGDFEALRDISLTIHSGEFICLLGASGCGKTTLLRIIAGLTPHDSGEIRLAGKDLSDTACHKRNIGMVFQSLALFPHLNVADNIGYGARLRGAGASSIDADVDRLLAMVGLEGLGARPISALSGGQKQRVAIARALALHPDIFLMDEPFSALDAALRDQMQIEVKRIQRDLGVTTVFVTHDQREAMALADRIVVMNGGRIEQAGPPDEIYARPVSRYVAEFIGTNNVFEVDVTPQGVLLGKDGLGQATGALAGLSGAQCFAIRPEAITLSETVSDHALDGTIIAQRRLGAVLEREIDVNGTSIFQSSFVGQGSNLADGAKVSVSWDWDAAWVLAQ